MWGGGKGAGGVAGGLRGREHLPLVGDGALDPRDVEGRRFGTLGGVGELQVMFVVNEGDGGGFVVVVVGGGGCGGGGGGFRGLG